MGPPELHLWGQMTLGCTRVYVHTHAHTHARMHIHTCTHRESKARPFITVTSRSLRTQSFFFHPVWLLHQNIFNGKFMMRPFFLSLFFQRFHSPLTLIWGFLRNKHPSHCASSLASGSQRPVSLHQRTCRATVFSPLRRRILCSTGICVVLRPRRTRGKDSNERYQQALWMWAQQGPGGCSWCSISSGAEISAYESPKYPSVLWVPRPSDTVPSRLPYCFLVLCLLHSILLD